MSSATKNAAIGNGLFDGNLPISPLRVAANSLGCLVLLGVILHFGVF